MLWKLASGALFYLSCVLCFRDVYRESLSIHWNVYEANEKAPLAEGGLDVFSSVFTNADVPGALHNTPAVVARNKMNKCVRVTLGNWKYCAHDVSITVMQHYAGRYLKI